MRTLSEWLAWQASLHPQEIELGLNRCHTVAQRLNLLQPPFPIITVGGTNGKGSSVAFLDAILTAAGYRVGRFTSPHLLHYNERIVITGQAIDNISLCKAFTAIEAARDQISLTFFEINTLAAMLIFQQSHLDVAILEVGLGGRLDAVNVFDADLALITAIGIDHEEWLGSDRESIGFEKAGIFRPARPAVCSDANPPRSLLNRAQQLTTPLYCLGRDFTYQKSNNDWSWQSQTRSYPQLPLPSLVGDFQLDNAAGVLMVLELFNAALPFSAIQQGLRKTKIMGRFQILQGQVTQILDVAHNPLGVQVLKTLLQQMPCPGQTIGVVGILQDKDIPNMLTPLRDTFAVWYVAPLKTPRSAKIEDLMAALTALPEVHACASITQAHTQALSQAKPGDRIVVFGSFYTVAEVLIRNSDSDKLTPPL